MDTPRKIRQVNYGATEKSPKCSNCQSMEELKDFFKSEMAVLSGQFKLVLEEQAQQKVQIAQLLRERSEAEGLSSLFPVTDKDELICLDRQIELGNCFVKIMTELLGSSGPKANLKYIITDELAMQYNVDGILGKASLKSLSFFYKALLVYENYISTGSILSKPRSGRPSVLTEWEKKRVVQLVPPNPRITAHQGRLEVAEQFKKISDQTVCRIWKKADYNEHLWDLLERRIRQHTITSKKMLKDVIMKEWSKITAEDTRKLVDSMPRRLAEVLKGKGYPTKY
ncbi:hypothetical protein ACLKA7_000789 [Drosophila subpalustris]